MSDDHSVLIVHDERIMLYSEGIQGPPGPLGGDGQEVELQNDGTFIQWRYVGEPTWTNLVAVSTLVGPAGTDGTDGINGTNGTDGVDGTDGADGREVEIQNSGTHIQWRYVGDPTWINIVALSVITGPAGNDGADGTDGDDGLSAYQIAVNNGFVGNEAAWLASLHGADGADGADGNDGADGASGNGVSVSVDFGASFTDKAQTVVTGQAWVTPASKIIPQVLTPTGVDPDEMYLLDIKAHISDIVDGVGFTVTLYSQPEAKGIFSVMCLGV